MSGGLIGKNPKVDMVASLIIGGVLLFLAYDFYGKLIALEQNGGSMKVNAIVYALYEMGGAVGAAGAFVAGALFFFYRSYRAFLKLKSS
ncbi:hypothetical protein BKK51_09080 [Rodentibacter trehalosifermentans]|uniref:Uncharacterized protein n=2 Tax=Rodentibacter trehalosifermentans TaxID=1908263 RepID=A0A1V3IQJ4_9PAST|nr:hypothetical protein [Rodentibacter trehalosifermentans]OOF44320.1 hypothetical protein BKK51_09080 [Rodentibacter trehalosifermentans]OOF47734.1 hypothetical protein BKK52_08130 [Rodentibacter trehalosifermentans]OOF49267.1 hypothetical protein BKK53_08865 [Rodentibacter trehalosifermentans]